MVGRSDVGVRLAVNGGEAARQTFRELGRDGERALRELAASAQRARPEMLALSNAVERLERDTERAADRLGVAGAALRGFGPAGIAAAAGAASVVGALSRASDVAGRFEEVMISNRIAANANAEQLEQLSALAILLGDRYAVGATAAALAIEEVLKAGVSFEDAINGAAEAAIAMARATGSEIPEGAAVAVQAMQLFGLGAERMASVASQATGVINETRFELQDYALALGQGGGAARSAGVEFEDFNATLAATASGFSGGSDQGTAFKTFLTRLADDSEEVRSAVEELGLEFYDANGALLAMDEIADNLQAAFQDLTEEQRQNRLQTIFGADAMRLAVAMSYAGGEGIRYMRDELIPATDALAQAEERTDGLRGSQADLRAAAEELAIVLGEAGLTRVLTQMNVVLAEGARGIAEFITGVEEAQTSANRLSTYVADQRSRGLDPGAAGAVADGDVSEGRVERTTVFDRAAALDRRIVAAEERLNRVRRAVAGEGGGLLRPNEEAVARAEAELRRLQGLRAPTRAGGGADRPVNPQDSFWADLDPARRFREASEEVAETLEEEEAAAGRVGDAQRRLAGERTRAAAQIEAALASTAAPAELLAQEIAALAEAETLVPDRSADVALAVERQAEAFVAAQVDAAGLRAEVDALAARDPAAFDALNAAIESLVLGRGQVVDGSSDLVAALQRETSAILDAGEANQQYAGRVEAMIRLRRRFETPDEAAQRAVDEASADVEAAVRSGAITPEEAEELLRRVNAEVKGLKDNTDALRDAQDRARDTFRTWTDLLSGVVEGGEAAERAVLSLIERVLELATTDFAALGGKGGLGGFLDSIVGALGSIFGGGSGGLGDLFGGGGKSKSGGFGGVPGFGGGFATGGFARPGFRYDVAEDGRPELFLLGGAGQVFSAAETARVLGQALAAQTPPAAGVAQAQALTIRVRDETGGRVEARETRGPEGAGLDLTIRRLVRAQLQAGEYDGAFRSRYGVRPAGGL